MSISTRVETNYEFHAAGRVWTVPELALTVLPDGSEAVSQAEFDRIHRAIANQLCGESEDLNWKAFEFLCTFTTTAFTAVAEHLSLHKSTVSRWREAGGVPHLASLALKRWFWIRLFAEELESWEVPVTQLGDDNDFLAMARQQAIDQRLVVPLQTKAA